MFIFKLNLFTSLFELSQVITDFNEKLTNYVGNKEKTCTALKINWRNYFTNKVSHPSISYLYQNNIVPQINLNLPQKKKKIKKKLLVFISFHILTSN